jgi:hypothetical protein
MTQENSIRVNWGVMGLILGAVIAIVGGLNSKLLITKDAADKMTNAAVLKTRAAICVAQFTNAPQYQERLKEFKALNFLSRDGFIEKGGWDKMPGEQKASEGVNRVCGDRIAESVEK